MQHSIWSKKEGVSFLNSVVTPVLARTYTFEPDGTHHHSFGG
jgi:hypothetical protein